MLLELKNLSKIYESRLGGLRHFVFDNLSLYLKGGNTCLIEGSNASGKTTLLHLIMGLRRATKGSVYVEFDRNNHLLKPRIGFCPDNPVIYSNVKVKDFLQFMKHILSVDNESFAEKLLKGLNLESKMNYTIGKLSKGTQHKLALIASILDKPQCIIWDEPFSSLDPHSVDFLINELKKFSMLNALIIVVDPSLSFTKISNRRINLNEFHEVRQ